MQSCVSDFCNATSGIRKTVHYDDSEGALRRGQTSQCLALSERNAVTLVIVCAPEMITIRFRIGYGPDFNLF